MAALIAGQSVDYIPDEYIDYILCRKFNCLPSELDEQDDYIVKLFLEIIQLENKEEERAINRIKKQNGKF